MAQVIEFTTQDGHKISFASLDADEGVQAVSNRAIETAERATETLSKSLAFVPSLVEDVRAAMKGLEVSKAGVEFSLAVGAKGSFFVVQGEASAALKVSVEIITK